MPINKEERAQIIKQFQLSTNDTGSTQVQAALLSKRINDLTPHFKLHKKDHHGRRGLLKMVSKRRKLLNYLKDKKFDEYKKLILKLGLSK